MIATRIKEGETGFLVPSGDIHAFAKALLHLLGDRELAERMGKAGRELALVRFSETVWIDKFLALYQTLRRRDARATAAN